jgi:hypothetical protein
MVFRGRLLLKVIVIMLVAVWAALLGVCLVQVVSMREFWLLYLLGPFFLLVGIYLAVMANRTFSTLSIDGQGVHVTRPLGSRHVIWQNVASIKYWEQSQPSGFGGSAVEPFALFRDNRGRRLLLIKSTYDPQVFLALLEVARTRNIACEVAGQESST